jgi:hypothetical protein
MMKLPHVLCGLGVRVSPHRALGAPCALAPVHLVAPSLCIEKSGPPGLCFLPRNSPGVAMESCLRVVLRKLYSSTDGLIWGGGARNMEART